MTTGGVPLAPKASKTQKAPSAPAMPATSDHSIPLPHSNDLIWRVQQRWRRDVNFVSNGLRDGRRSHFSFLVQDAHNRERAAGDFDWRRGVELHKAEHVTERLSFLFADKQLD